MRKLSLKKTRITAICLTASLCCGLFIWTGCSHKDDDGADPVKAAVSVTVKNLPADPVTYDPNTGAALGGTNRYTFFRFSDSSIVANSDSASDRWDIGFRGTDIVINGGTSGPGQTLGEVADGIFDEITEAPSSGYATDAATGHIFQNWFNYDMQTHIVTPLAGQIFFIHTTGGKYVKMELLSYYQNAPASPTLTDAARYYTFRYAIQADGGTKF